MHDFIKLLKRSSTCYFNRDSSSSCSTRAERPRSGRSSMKSDSTCSPLTAELLQKSLHPPSNSTTEKKAIETGSAARRRNPWTLRLRPASERWCSWAHEKRDFLRRRASAPNPRAWFLKARFLYQNAWIAMPKSDERSYSSSFNSCRLLQKSGLRISASWIGLNLVPRAPRKNWNPSKLYWLIGGCFLLRPVSKRCFS